MSADIESWFSRWWQDLPKHHFTSQNKGSRAECLKEVQKLAPDEELRDKIDWYTRELALRTAKMKSKDIKVAGFKHACRLIKYKFWDDDLPSISTERDKVAAKRCSKCDADATWQNLCWKHYDELHADKCVFSGEYMKERFIADGNLHKESKRDRAARCAKALGASRSFGLLVGNGR